MLGFDIGFIEESSDFIDKTDYIWNQSWHCIPILTPGPLLPPQKKLKKKEKEKKRKKKKKKKNHAGNGN